MNPLFFVVVAPAVAALLPLAVPRRVRRGFRVLLAIAAASVAALATGRVDALALVFTALVSVLSALATATAAGGDVAGATDEGTPWRRGWIFFGLLGTFWSAMLIVVLAGNFTVLWLGISATTLATAFLVGFGGDATALEAAWKYLVLCSVGIAFALLGMLLIAHVALAAGIAPPLALSWDAIARHPWTGDAPLARLGAGLMLIGFATKAGLVPMHAWLPDAHSKAPAPVSGLLSGVLVSCALYAVMRTLQAGNALGAGSELHGLLVALGCLSTVVAGALMVAQRDLKRLLAYSTVEHAGLVALALGCGGPLGTVAALFHVLTHAFAKAGTFFSVGLVQRERGTTSLGELRALWQDGATGRLLLGGMSALAGLPPFGIFVSELLVIAAAVTARNWAALGAAVVGIGLAFAAIARATIDIESGRGRPPAPRRARATALAKAAVGLALVGASAIALVPWLPAAHGLQSSAAAFGAVFP